MYLGSIVRCGRRTTRASLWQGGPPTAHEGSGRGPGASPLWLRMWISRELALGQLLRHWGKGQTRSLG